MRVLEASKLEPVAQDTLHVECKQTEMADMFPTWVYTADFFEDL